MDGVLVYIDIIVIITFQNVDPVSRNLIGTG